jgi:hypothetical protein
MLLLAGFVVLHRALVAGDSPRIVDQLAFIATIMSAATLTVFRRLCPETRRRRMGGRHWARTDGASSATLRPAGSNGASTASSTPWLG